jgi:ornithine carbamoyltransferase
VRQLLPSRIERIVIAVADTLRGRHFTRVADWSRPEWLTALDLADQLKVARAAGEPTPLLSGRTLGMIFQKPSTRTRVSFEVGISQLGGVGLYLAASDLQLGRGETIRDTAVVLSRYLEAIMIRTFAQADVEELARHATVPVINGLTDEEHPCQALADVMTIRERLGRLEGVRIAYVGDGNNVCVSLAKAADLLGMDFVAATPPGYEPPLQGIAVTHDPREAAAGAEVLYTDVWTSMGQEDERASRLDAFRGFTVDAGLVALADPAAIVLHCLPAHYGEEISEDVLYGAQSAVWDEAENRLHAQKALMALIIR